MFDNITIGFILASAMTIVGDMFALLAFATAGMALLGALFGVPRRRLLRPLSTSLSLIAVSGIGLIAKLVSPGMAAMPNGVFIGLDNIAIIVVLIGAASLLVGMFTLTALKGALRH